MSSYYEKFIATGEVKCIDEEIPFEIPKGWEWERLGNITTIKGGKRIPVGMKLTLKNTGHKYIRVADMKNHSVKCDDIHYITDDIYEIIKAYYISKDDLYITVAGTIGNVGVVPEEFDNANLTENADKIEIYSLCKLYLLYALLSEVVQEQVRECTTKVGQPKLAIVRIQKFLIPIAPLAEQRRISERIDVLLTIVDRYDVLFSKLGKLNNSINEFLKKSILQEAIQGRLVPQITEEGSANELLEQIKEEKKQLVKEGKLKKLALNDSTIFRGDDNKYWEKKGTTCECIDEDIPFDIPKSWAWARLETILNTGSARRVHAKDWRQAGIPFYRAREIGKLADEGFVDNELYIDLSLYEDFSSSGVPLPNDLMITAVGTLGKVYIVKESDKFYYKDGSVLCLANKYGLCAEYLKMVIESPFFKGQYRQESQGTTVATLTMVRLQKYFIPIPPLQEQYRIVETYRNIASIMSR